MTAFSETFTNLHKTRRGLDRLLHVTSFSAAGLRHGWKEPAFRLEAGLAVVTAPVLWFRHALALSNLNWVA
jgi:diacylglycerol kinase